MAVGSRSAGKGSAIDPDSLILSPLPVAILYMVRKVVWETEPTFLAQ